MNTQAIINTFDKHVISNYTRHPIVIMRGEGSYVWDANGKKYLDLFPGWGVSGIGHCHPKVVEAVRQQAGVLFHVANNFYTEPQGRFAEMLSTRGDGQKCFFANSGAEANEGAIKLARLFNQPKYKVITFSHSFHGRTFAAISATGQPDYQKGFAPILPGFSYATLNDIASVKALVDDETAAIMLEPVQGEGGVHPCTLEFLQDLRSLCDEKGMLLIFDEVQTSPARLGTWFGYQYFGVTPDILTTAKAIAGGMPMGLIMARPDVAESMRPGTHASTFGGNAIGCAAGIAMLEAIEEEGMLENIKSIGHLIELGLRDLQAQVGGIREIRRIGMMVGVELEFPGADIVLDCMEHGLLVNCTHGNILRMLPAFNLKEDDFSYGLDILRGALERAVQAAGVRG